MSNFLKQAFYRACQLTQLKADQPELESSVLPELPFTIVMMGYNNEKYIRQSINSALSQNYNNFKVIYNEACSTDSSPQILEEIENKRLIKRINKNRKYRLQNLYESIHTTDNQEIILELDGDDYLKDKFVLTRLNQMYQTNNYFIIHGNYKNVPEFIAIKYGYKTFSQKTPWIVKKLRGFRRFPWIYSGLRSYYSWLFKKIKKEDLIFDTQFSPVCCDVATMYPMLEMVPNNVGYIQEPLIIRNIDSPINEFKVITKDQLEIRKKIIAKRPYEKLF